MNESADGAAPSSRARAEALRILVEVERGGWSDRLLQAREGRLAEARERGFLHVLVLTTLRWQGALDGILAPLVRRGLGRLDPPARAALRLGLCQASLLDRPPAIAVDATLDALKSVAGPRAAGLVNAVLRRALVAGPPALDESATVPPWLLARWTDAFGAERARKLVAAANRPGRPFALARPDRGGREVLRQRLAARGIETRPAARHPWGLCVLGGAPQSTPEFLAGDFLLMDEAAALVALLATPRDDRPVADLTAAPGGKSVLIALGARGPVLALELVAQRAATMGASVRQRAPAGRVLVVRADALHAPAPSGAFGTVLLDAPCSGTGTLRRRPEKKTRLAPGDVLDCARRQAALLDAAAPLVAAGGELIYAVCSLEPEEGRRQVEQFLASHREFVIADPGERLGDAGRDLATGDPPLFATRPDEDEHDGFVAARMVRRGDALSPPLV